MRISYHRLLKLMIDKNMKKKDLQAISDGEIVLPSVYMGKRVIIRCLAQVLNDELGFS